MTCQLHSSCTVKKVTTAKINQDIVARVLSNQEEVKRISEQLTSQKLLDFYKESVNYKDKKLAYEAFVKEVYGK